MIPPAPTVVSRILVIDDEPQIHRFLKPALEASGYEVCQAYTARDGLRMVAEHAPAGILLDLGLPDFDGQEVIRRIRAFSRIPIIIVSARDVEAEKIRALDNGADDFIDKPFSVGELLARLRSCLRRMTIQENPIEFWKNGDIYVNISQRKVLVRNEEVYFTPKEYDLLNVLIRNSGVVLTHRQLLIAVWGSGHEEDIQYLRVYIGVIRQKLGSTGASTILTVSRIGYRAVEQ